MDSEIIPWAREAKKKKWQEGSLQASPHLFRALEVASGGKGWHVPFKSQLSWQEWEGFITGIDYG